MPVGELPGGPYEAHQIAEILIPMHSRGWDGVGTCVTWGTAREVLPIPLPGAVLWQAT